jgi:hypothetical protein
VISLKDIFFEHADSLIGVYKDQARYLSFELRLGMSASSSPFSSSHVLTLDLRHYPINEVTDEDNKVAQEEEDLE